jgi:hypothetical protein
MSYGITYYGIEGLAPVTARVTRKLDGNVLTASGWGTSSPVDIDLTEDVLIPGKYTGTANFEPGNGGVYTVALYLGSVLLFEMDCLYKSRQQTVLQIINEVQKSFRLPQSTLITDAHAALLLGFANEVQLDYVAEFCQWEEAKVRAAFNTVAGRSVYSICPLQDLCIDTIAEMRIGTSDPLTKPPVNQFRQSVRTITDYSQPTSYGHFGRSGTALLVELNPTPDSVYRINADLLIKPQRMVLADDIPLLDQDIITLGVKLLCRKDQGEDIAAELAAFQAKLSLRGGAYGEGQSTEIDFL